MSCENNNNEMINLIKDNNKLLRLTIQNENIIRKYTILNLKTVIKNLDKIDCNSNNNSKIIDDNKLIIESIINSLQH